jgi:outer membrane immunogenic protein
MCVALGGLPSAWAADLASPPAAAFVPAAQSIYSPVPSLNWAGLSVGVVGGAGLGRSAQSYTDQSFSTDDYRLKGGLAGAHATVDYQSGNWVWGLGGDLQWSSIKGSVVATPPAGAPATFSTRLNWLYTGYVRVGYAFERFLPYVVAGPAFGGVKISGTIPGAGAVSRSQTWLGWGVGVGLAYAITNDLIARLEYTYVCLGESVQFSVDNAEFMTHLARIGLDYKFAIAGLYDANPTPTNANHNWTGLYVGFNVGGLSGKVDTTYPVGGTAPWVGLHGMVGLQSGYNVQLGNYVIGAETDLQVTGQSSNWTATTAAGGTIATIITEQKVPVLFTVRGRAGYAMNNWLFYGTGGFAFGEVESNVTVNVPRFAPVTASFEKSRPGWTVGAGVEAELLRGWTAKFEYLFVDFGGVGETFAGVGPLAVVTAKTTVHDHSLRVGINRLFN